MTNYDYDLVLPDRLAGGESPPADASCATAYHWARSKGAYSPFGLRLQIKIAAQRYSQLDLKSVGIKPLAPLEWPATPMVFRCDGERDPGTGTPSANSIGVQPELEFPDPNLPAEYREPATRDLSSSFGLGQGDEVGFPVDISATNGVARTPFVIELHVVVNGRELKFDLADGDNPYVIGPYPGGAGLDPPHYRWCPGASGKLLHREGVIDGPGTRDTCP
jgi:hypothetical protein